MRNKIFKYIKMMFLLLLLFEGVVPHHHVLSSCVGHCSMFSFQKSKSQDIAIGESQHIVVHGTSTMLKEKDNIISLIIALACVIPIYYSLRVSYVKKVWSSFPNFRTSFYNCILVVYLFFRPPPITA